MSSIAKPKKRCSNSIARITRQLLKQIINFDLFLNLVTSMNGMSITQLIVPSYPIEFSIVDTIHPDSQALLLRYLANT